MVIYVLEKSRISEDIEEYLMSCSTELIAYDDKTAKKITQSDIYCFIVEDNKVYALTENEKLRLRQRLYVLEENLGGDFVKINQSFVAILSTYLLAFIHAGVSVFNQIEEWSIAKSLLCHLGTLYVAYTLCYLINSWIPFDPKVLLIYTLCFVTLYFIVWVSVFVAVKLTENKLNSKLK